MGEGQFSAGEPPQARQRAERAKIPFKSAYYFGQVFHPRA
jgi:hypothetical protein